MPKPGKHVLFVDAHAAFVKRRELQGRLHFQRRASPERQRVRRHRRSVLRGYQPVPALSLERHAESRTAREHSAGGAPAPSCVAVAAGPCRGSANRQDQHLLINAQAGRRCGYARHSSTVASFRLAVSGGFRSASALDKPFRGAAVQDPARQLRFDSPERSRRVLHRGELPRGEVDAIAGTGKGRDAGFWPRWSRRACWRRKGRAPRCIWRFRRTWRSGGCRGCSPSGRLPKLADTRTPGERRAALYSHQQLGCSKQSIRRAGRGVTPAAYRQRFAAAA